MTTATKFSALLLVAMVAVVVAVFLSADGYAGAVEGDARLVAVEAPSDEPDRGAALPVVPLLDDRDPAPLKHAPEQPAIESEPEEMQSLRLQLSQVIAERDALATKLREAENQVLSRQRFIAHQFREQDAAVAIAHFRSSPEYKELWSDAEREEVEIFLTEFPVILKPGEATFIGERTRYNDWDGFLQAGEQLNAATAAKAAFGLERLKNELRPNVLRLSSLGDGFRPPR